MAIYENPELFTGSGGEHFGPNDLRESIAASATAKIEAARRLVHPRHELSAHMGIGNDALKVPSDSLEEVEHTDEPGKFSVKIHDKITGRNIAIAATGAAILGLTVHIAVSKARHESKK